MRRRQAKYVSRLMVGAAAIAFTGLGGTAWAQGRQADFDIPPQPLASALKEFGFQSGYAVLATPALAETKVTRGVTGETEVELALNQLLAGTGLTYRRTEDTFLIVQAGEGGSGPQSAGAGGDVDALIVTAQKRAENIQDVPIAISAFTQEDLTDRQVAGGPDLITQIPNMSFTKTNFTGYSIQIRGIGTQAISATTDPAVAVAFNNTPFIRNRFFEQEFYDLERLEVLRGPQGTLYGRNATAGVVNLISAKPKFVYEAKLSADVGNYANQRLEGMINIPLAGDVVALRLAGASTQRDGYATNQITGNPIDGRSLWSARATLRFEPNDWISANLIYEHFQEDDDRLRSGKQLCKNHAMPDVNGIPYSIGFSQSSFLGQRAYFNQGCTAVSLYSDEAFQAPNGYSLPFFGPIAAIGAATSDGTDPYLHATQSRDLRVIESSVDPDYKANTDLVEFQVAIDLGDYLTLSSETAYNADSVFSLQDYNRFTTAPGSFVPGARNGAVDATGVFCDPQVGCSNRLTLVDLSTSDSTQFNQEFRLGSDFDGPFNFSLGANFTRHDTMDKYYVFINSISTLFTRPGYVANISDNHEAFDRSPGSVGETAVMADPFRLTYSPGGGYMDPNPIGSLNDQGRNYFLSQNPYKLISYAAFGEAYYQITDNLKLTAGLRFTIDRKQAPQIPSWILVGGSAGLYPTVRVVDQEWREPSGRLALDWKPDLSFTDDTLLYASYAHGYKAGGANPPPPVVTSYVSYAAPEFIPDIFGPEFVDAFELGAKNILLDGAMTLNLAAFYYDYEGYQTSEIRNRAAVNSNYDAKIWGLELEAEWRPTDTLRLGFKGGYNGTRIDDGMRAIDLMDRTAGDPDWIVMRPAPWDPSNCIMPLYVVTTGGVLHIAASNSTNRICEDTYFHHVDPITGLPYVPNPGFYLDSGTLSPFSKLVGLGLASAGYPGFDPDNPIINGGRGFYKELGGNELPNAPRYTATVTTDYTLPLSGDWLLTLHGDYHYQSQSWGRIFNSEPYDRIRAFSTVNASAIITNEEAGWKVMAYVKNVFDETAITGTFLNSDDSGLTTNVFLTEPRLYGLRVTKDWTGGGFGWLGEGRGQHTPGTPYPFEVEIGGGVSRFGGEAENYAPDWVVDNLATLGSALSAQTDDLDWGDTRQVKLTYRPADGWSVAAGYRFGRTNGAHRVAAYDTVPVNSSGGGLDNHEISAVHDVEEHSIIDFVIGKDVGLGVFGRDITSRLGAGLRYASFESTSHVITDGITESYVPAILSLKYTASTPRKHYNAFTNALDSIREVEAYGPILSWDAALRLAGSDEAGHADLDLSIAGGVLFGKQTTDTSEDRWGQYTLGGAPATKTSLYNVANIPSHRSEDVTVPNLSLSLGVSYSIDRMKVSTGYSYDRFFDAIDGGVSTSKSYDRTIEGPYLKLSLGFGG